jgi:predicted proteasome-type protease
VASIQARDDTPYFVTMRRVGVTVLVGAIGEIANVSRERSTRPSHPDPNIF